MSLKQTVYFMALVGGLAGLSCWVIQAFFLSDFFQITQERQWILTTIYTTLLGAWVGGLTVGFADHWTGDRVVARWVAAGVLLGILAGILSGLISIPIFNTLIQARPNTVVAFFGRTLTWMFAGGLIGFATGWRWFGVNKFRSFHALVGGLIGGFLGGIIFGLGGSGDFFQALAFVLTGMGVTLGVTLAPVLLRDGVLQFVSSGDPRAQNKYASPRQEWLIQDGDRYVLGSQGADMTMTMYARDVQIYIPDAMVLARHAVLFARGKRFYIQQHPDNTGPQGQPEAPIQVGDDSVNGVHELYDQDQVILGQTLLRFCTRKRRSPDRDLGGRR